MNENERRVKSILDGMSLEQKIGQCTVVGMSGTQITNDLREAILRYHCGGVRLSPFTRLFRYFSDDRAKKNDLGPNYEPSGAKRHRMGPAPYLAPEQYAAMLNELRDLGASRDPAIPLHMVIDQEGDTSKDFSRGGVVQFPSNMGLAASGDTDLTYRVAKAVALQMKAYGLDMIHSPVVDVNVNPANPEIGRRAFSDDPEVVAAHAIAMVRGFKEGGVIAAAKHFPGRGDSAVDAHHACPSLDADVKRLHAVELLPYKRLIESGELDSVMVAHCIYPAWDEAISTVSKRIVTGVLREELGFSGLITTDSMTMGALIDRYGVGEACARALEAGVDVILMKAENTWRGEMYHEIHRFVEEGRISEADLDAKVSRILDTKLRYGLFENFGKVDAAAAPASHDDPVVVTTAREAAEKSIMVCKNDGGLLPLDRSKRTLLVNQQNSVKSPNDAWDHPALFQEMLEDGWLDLETIEMPFGADEAAQADAVALATSGDYDQVIVTSFYDRSAQPNGAAAAILGASNRPQVILVTNTPYRIKNVGGLLPEADAIVLGMNLSPQGYAAIRDVLDGKLVGGAKWPLSNYDPLALGVHA